jgi:uncharacterized protein
LFLGFLLTGTVLSVFVGSGILLAKGFATPASLDFNNPKFVEALKTVQVLYTILGFLLPALIYALVTFKLKQLYFLGFRPSQKFYFYLVAIVLMLISFPLASWFGELNERIPLAKWMVEAEREATNQMDAFLKTNSSKNTIGNLLIIGLIPAICEEACFRGALQRIFINICKSPWAGIILSAIFFSAFHMEFAGFLPRMFLGILLGALYWYSGSLWVSITAHFFNNASQLILILYYPKMADENPSVPFYAAVGSALIVWGLLLFIQRQSKLSYKSVYEFENAEM